MKTFRDHLNEEIKIGALASGGIDIERDAVRDEINGILSAVAARPCVTPYSSLNKVRKALAYFSIFLPKRVYLEGRHGMEVWEVNQFGDKMGVTDQGEWIHHVPCKYYLFFHYHRMGGMYYLEAKIVDETELEKKINAAEKMAVMAESNDSACRQDMAKHMAPKEPMHDVTSDEKKKGNKEAVSDSEKGLKEAKKIKVKLNPEKKIGFTVHDVGPGGKKTLVKSGETKVKDIKEGRILRSLNDKDEHKPTPAYAKKMEQEKRDADDKRRKDSIKRDLKRFDKKGIFGGIKEGRMPASVIKHKQKLANMTPEEKAKKFAGKSEEELKSMARRHGYGKDSTEYSKHVKEEQIDEKLTKGMSAADVIHDFVHSDDPKFKGKSVKERQKMALGAYYGMHPEKSKKNLEEDAYIMRKMKEKMATKVRHGLGVGRETQTVMVKSKSNPASKPHRIPKDKYDPSKYVMV